MTSIVVVSHAIAGIVEVAAPAKTDIVAIDIDAIRNGRPLPAMTQAHWDCLRQELPHVFAELKAYDYHYECANCGTRYASLDNILPLENVFERVAPGEPMPVGECPECHAVVHPIVDDWYQVPNGIVERLDLRASFYLSAGALPVAHWYGMDRLLAHFKSMPIAAYDEVGQPVQVGNTGFLARRVEDVASVTGWRVEIIIDHGKVPETP